MANYVCSCRSNHFKVKDRAAFDEWASQYEISVHDGKDDTVCILGEDPDGAGWPSWDHETDEEIDFPEQLAKHLTDDTVAILMETGAEKLRYLCGVAIAIRSDGEILCINLHDIYKKVEKEWGIKPTPAEY